MPRCTMPPSSAPRTHFGRGWWISAHIVPNRISLLILTTDFEGATVDIVKGNMGWIEVVVGPMFSGKSEELIRRLRRAEIARQRVQIFKPAIDERYAANEIVSHSGLGIPSDSVFKALKSWKNCCRARKSSASTKRNSSATKLSTFAPSSRISVNG